jgi:hypothetical protein
MGGDYSRQLVQGGRKPKVRKDATVYFKKKLFGRSFPTYYWGSVFYSAVYLT